MRLVRNGYLPERTIQTGVGDVPVKAPQVRDRAGELHFSSAILPPYLRRTKTIEEPLPWLYLKGISTGDSRKPERCWGATRPGCRRARSAA
ncbi:MAG: transposase [Burkholderiales bacterium]|nr:transposase [Burkholderiales bacterium]